MADCDGELPASEGFCGCRTWIRTRTKRFRVTRAAVTPSGTATADIVTLYGVSVEACSLVSATPPASMARRILTLSSIGGWVEKRPLERFSNLLIGLTM